MSEESANAVVDTIDDDSSEQSFISADQFSEMISRPEGSASPEGEQSASAEQPLTQGPSASSEQEIAATGSLNLQDPNPDTPVNPNQGNPLPDWKSEISKLPVAEVLAALGLDEKISALVSKYQETGDVSPYLKAIGTDWSKAKSEDLLKEMLKAEYSEQGFTDEEIDEIYQEELAHYKLSGDDVRPIDQKMASIKLDKRVAEYRRKLVEENEKLLIPSTEPKTSQNPVLSDEAKRKYYDDENQKAISYFKDSLGTGNKDLQSIIASKSLNVGEGSDAYSFSLDGVESKLETLHNPEKYVSVLYDEKGNAKPKENLLAALFLSDMNGFINNLIQHGKKLGTAAYHDELENASTLNGGTNRGSSDKDDFYTHAAKTATITTYR
ncbi:hypothetical protein [Polluticaenibacter yanchengensis]|uniref:Uncharacterized protein n=1 Tax=Polluticaenibacter yanchengensis TaxID=3014562 RepID=A0ABT4UJC5_9BACT|nr:hypothetical protein [Chitinophagaceae bacterium LY-5]